MTWVRRTSIVCMLRRLCCRSSRPVACNVWSSYSTPTDRPSAANEPCLFLTALMWASTASRN